MKKIRLNVANLEGTEILSREQLKSIFGGSDGSDGSDSLTNDNCVDYSCGASNKPCCASTDYCSDASSKGVCTTRK